MRKPKKATPIYLERVALWYLERYGGSEARLRRILRERVRRSVEEHGTDRDEGAEAIDQVVAKLVRLGYVDDARFAKSRAGVLERRGKSSRAIRSALRQQGIAAVHVDEVLSDVDDLEAARKLVRKKRLGTHRAGEDQSAAERAVRRKKDLARLARAGFSYDVARRALEGE